MFISKPWLPIGVVLVLCLTGVLYWPGLFGSFMFDDFPNIVDNTGLRLFDGSFSSLISASSHGAAGPLGRPLSMASFALNLHAYGASAFSFKLVNLIIHLTNGLLVFVLAGQVSARFTRTKYSSSLIALWVAAVWLLHPINLTPVLFVVQRMTGLAAFFTLAALSLYLYGRQASRPSVAWTAIFASVFLFWPAAIMSKETGLLWPFFLFLCEWLVLGSFRSIPQKTKWVAVIFFSVTLVGLMTAKWGYITGGYASRDFGLIERVMTEARVLWFYLLQLFAPWPNFFSLYHDDIPISRTLVSPPHTLFAIVAWLILIAAAIYGRKRAPLFAFAVFWFLAAHALESTIFPLEIAFEHRNYLASLGIFIWLGTLLFAPHAKKNGQVARVTLALSFLLYCGLITALRADQWGDEYRRTQMEATSHPNSARTNYSAAVVVVRRTFDAGGGNDLAYQMAKYHYQRAAMLNPNNFVPLLGMLNLDCATSRAKNLSLQLQLRERFAHARLTAENQAGLNRLPTLLIEGRLCLDAEEVKALIDAGLSNTDAQGHMRAVIYSVAMDYTAVNLRAPLIALSYARAAVDSDPGYAPFRLNLTHLLLAMNNVAAARQEYNSILKLAILPRDRASVDALNRRLVQMEQNASTR